MGSAHTGTTHVGDSDLWSAAERATSPTDGVLHCVLGDDIRLQHAVSGLRIRVVVEPSVHLGRATFARLDARQGIVAALTPVRTSAPADLEAAFQDVVGHALHLRAARLFPGLRWRLSGEEDAAAVLRPSLHRMDPFTWELDCSWCDRHLPRGEGWAGATPGAFLDHP